MASVDVIRQFISENIPQWSKVEDSHLSEQCRDCDLYSVNAIEKVVFAYTNVNITGTERAKPQIRVFLDKVKAAFEYSKEHDYKFFLFTVFTQPLTLATGLTAFNPHEFLVSLETNLDNEESRRDLRSLYDFVQDQLNGRTVRDFIRCPQNEHRAGIKQASFIRIKDGNNAKTDTLKKYVKYFDSRPYLLSVANNGNDDEPLENELSSPYSEPPTQLIYYGVPGCGKSHKVEKEICGIIDSFNNSAAEKISYEKQVTRVVFHPDYCNADFIGQIVPVLDSEHHVKYEFKAGPFTQILRKAYLNPSKPYFLVIEEINRGNAAAIFGDVFQLLDRFKSGEHSKNLPINNENFDYTQGWSKYVVSNDDVNGFVRQGPKLSASEIENVVYDSDFPEDPEAAIKIPGWGDLHFSVYSGIRLPPNLSIYATMNTSDQNVFTLDNAFKRRFDSELIKNSLDGVDHDAQRETKIEGTEVTWGKFWECINDLILEKHSSMTSSEDKRLGAYFIVGEEKTAEDGTTYREISKKLFGEKVLEYLWDDAFKYKRKDVFTEDCKSVESLIEKFTSGGFSAVFKNLEF